VYRWSEPTQEARWTRKKPCLWHTSCVRQLNFVGLIVNQGIAFFKWFIYNSVLMDRERRAYTLRKRAVTAAETRLRIIEAACDLLTQAGYHSVSLDDIAAGAGVSRQTIYLQFGSKRGVLQAVAEHVELQSYGLDMLEGVRTVQDPTGMIRNGITTQLAFFSQNANLLRTFYAQAASDPDFRDVWQDRLRKRWDAIHVLIERIAGEGKLAEGWNITEASDWIWSLTNFRLYDEMVQERGWTPEQLARRIVQAIDLVLLVGGQTTKDQRRRMKDEGPKIKEKKPKGKGKKKGKDQARQTMDDRP
jgi:AcrR family transcriptional regulator